MVINPIQGVIDIFLTMNFYSLVVFSVAFISLTLANESLNVGLVSNLKSGDKNVTKPFLDKFEKDAS
uniref:CNNM transmembrane domain-containing protein n=1 Tax=Strongyloides venezuelensis TaxID=75913 RepID=A0A0K0EYM3_STRVS